MCFLHLIYIYKYSQKALKMLSIPFSGKHVRIFYHFYIVSHMPVPARGKDKKKWRMSIRDGMLK